MLPKKGTQRIQERDCTAANAVI